MPAKADASSPRPKTYIRELDEAMESIGSGVGYSSERIFAWLRSWGTTDELASPAPDRPPPSMKQNQCCFELKV